MIKRTHTKHRQRKSHTIHVCLVYLANCIEDSKKKKHVGPDRTNVCMCHFEIAFKYRYTLNVTNIQTALSIVR